MTSKMFSSNSQSHQAILRDISSVPVHPISEGTNLKIVKCYSDIPGAEVSQLDIR